MIRIKVINALIFSADTNTDKKAFIEKLKNKDQMIEIAESLKVN